MLKTELEDLVVIFPLNLVFLWKIFSRLLLGINSPLEILDIGQQIRIRLNCLMTFYILI